MKKLLLVLAIGSLFAVACNDGGSAETEVKADSTAPVVDSTPAPTVADTTAPAPVADTTKKDTTKKK